MYAGKGQGPLPARGLHPAARTRLRREASPSGRETLTHLQGEKCVLRGTCPRKTRLNLVFAFRGEKSSESLSALGSGGLPTDSTALPVSGGRCQTVDKPMRQSLDTHGGIVKGGGYAPLHVQSMPKWELFRKFPFWRFKLSTLCRQLETGRGDPPGFA